jgi:hypothetical protein
MQARWEGKPGRITAKAVCRDCGGEVFEIGIGGFGEFYVFCPKEECRTIWAATVGAGGEDARAAEAVGSGGDEPEDLVPAAGRGEG